jgi:hypothetical protein
MIEPALLDGLIVAGEKEMAKVDENFFREFPIEFYVNKVSGYSKFSGPQYVSPKLKAVFDQIRSKYGFHILSSYHKLALAYLISNSLKKLDDRNLPESITQLYREWFERAVRDFSGQPDDYYSLRNGLFLVDLTVCSLRAVPVGGAWLVTMGRATGRLHLFHLLSRVLRTALKEIRGKADKSDFRLRQEIKEAYCYIRVILFRTRGAKPFFIIHSYGRYLPRYTCREMERAYLRIAELLELSPKIRGVYRCSWFLDPALGHISPELAYLREIPIRHGAKLFRIGTDPSLDKTAIALSALRKRLYREGKYLPTWYAYIWPRIDLLEWAHRGSKPSA